MVEIGFNEYHIISRRVFFISNIKVWIGYKLVVETS